MSGWIFFTSFSKAFSSHCCVSGCCLFSILSRNVFLLRTHSLLWAVLLFALAVLFAPAAFGEEMTRFELEERVQEEEDTTEVTWMNDTSGVDTIEYHAIDLLRCGNSPST
jgi:hypothetical protein